MYVYQSKYQARFSRRIVNDVHKMKKKRISKVIYYAS